MDRTAVFNTTVSAAQHRLEEKQYGDEIYRNLRTLALFQRISDELDGLLSVDMFTKPNSAAFLHVSHYLFNLLDAREFRRSFYWPCRDKTSESKFRTASVALTNTLIERHQMPLEPLKMHNVVLPGGLKFMRIIFELTVVALREIIRLQTPLAPDDVGSFNLDTAVRKRREYQAMALKFFQKLDINLAAIQSQTQHMRSVLNELAPSEAAAQQMDGAIEAWDTHLDNVFERQLRPAAQFVTEFGQLCERLTKQVQRIATNRHKRCVDVGPDAIKQCQDRLLEQFASVQPLQPFCTNNEYDFVNIVNIFELLLPSIATRIATFRYRCIDAEVAASERQMIEQMVTDVTTLKLDSDAELQRIENYFERAQQKYPFDSAELLSSASITTAAAFVAPATSLASATSMANVVEPLDMRSRFLCTPPVRMKATPAASNPIMSQHLPWTYEEHRTNAIDGDKIALIEATGVGNHFNKPSAIGHLRPATALNQSLLSRSGRTIVSAVGQPAAAAAVTANASHALSMLSRVRNRCNGKADAQWRSSTNATLAATNGATSLICSASPSSSSQTPIRRVAGDELRAAAARKLLALKAAASVERPSAKTTSTDTIPTAANGSHSKANASQPTEKLFESQNTLQPDALLKHQRCQTNQVIRLRSAANSPIEPDFLRTSPSGRFMLIDDPSPSIRPASMLSCAPTVSSEMSPPPTEPIAGDVETTTTSSQRSLASSSDGSLATITARKIVFSPDSSPVAKDGTHVAAPAIRLMPPSSPNANDDIVVECSLFNVSDSVLQNIML